MATTAKDQAARAASIELEPDPPRRQVALNAAPFEPRTAPGQTMDLMGKYRSALATIEELKSESHRGTPLDLAIREIYTVPGRKRTLSSTERAELKGNLAKNALMHPIVVRPRNERGYELVSGHNRVELYGELERETIRAVIVDIEDEKADVAAFYTNLMANALPDYLKYVGLKQRKEEAGFTFEELEEDSGLAQQVISRLFQFKDLPAAAHSILDEYPHILGATAATKLARAAAAGNAERVVEAVNLLAGATKGSRFTEEKAVAYATGATPGSPVPAVPERVVKSGKKVFCRMKARGDQVTMKFGDQATADEWIAKFEKFIKDEMKKDAQ